MNNVISLSGGKDSTAMLLMMLENGESIHSVIWFDTGWEFPQMYNHINKLEEHIGIKVIRLKPERSFDYWMFERQIRNRKTKQIERVGNGWPSFSRRWCTREKVTTIEEYKKGITDPIHCIGFAFDEQKRTKSKNIQKEILKGNIRFPLIEHKITEKEALKFCISRGFDWDGLYNYFDRVSCWCCPLQPDKDLKSLMVNYPDLWKKLKDMDGKQPIHNQGFKGYKRVIDLENKFQLEERKLEKRLRFTEKAIKS